MGPVVFWMVSPLHQVIPSSKIRAAQVNTTELAKVEMLPLEEAIAVGSKGRGRAVTW